VHVDVAEQDRDADLFAIAHADVAPG